MPRCWLTFRRNYSDKSQLNYKSKLSTNYEEWNSIEVLVRLHIIIRERMAVSRNVQDISIQRQITIYLLSFSIEDNPSIGNINFFRMSNITEYETKCSLTTQ